MAKFQKRDLRILAFMSPASYKPSQRLLKLSMQIFLIIKLFPIDVPYKLADKSMTKSGSALYSNKRLSQPIQISPCSSSTIDSMKTVIPAMDLFNKKCLLPVSE